MLFFNLSAERTDWFFQVKKSTETVKRVVDLGFFIGNNRHGFFIGNNWHKFLISVKIFCDESGEYPNIRRLEICLNLKLKRIPLV